MFNRISQLNDHYIIVDQARYAPSVVEKYLDTATIKQNSKFHKTTLLPSMIFTKEDASTSDEHAEVPFREYNIHWRYCVLSLVYISSTGVDLCFSVQKLAKFSSNPGKVHFGGLLHLLRRIRHNTNLGLIYYSKISDATLSDLLRQASLKNENQLMVFSDCKQQYFQYTGIITGACIVFYQGGPIDHCTHVPGSVVQSSSESEYNTARNAVLSLEHFRIINNELLNKDKYVIL